MSTAPSFDHEMSKMSSKWPLKSKKRRQGDGLSEWRALRRKPERFEGEPVLFVLVLVVVKRFLVLDVVLVPQEDDALVASTCQNTAIVVPSEHVYGLVVALEIGNKGDTHAIRVAVGGPRAARHRLLHQTVLGEIDIPKLE